MTFVVNLQRKVKLETVQYQAFISTVSASVKEAVLRHFSVAFISDRRMIELNKLFRSKD